MQLSVIVLWVLIKYLKELIDMEVILVDVGSRLSLLIRDVIFPDRRALFKKSLLR